MKKIGIIGAMENEVKTLIQMMDIEKTVDKASLKFYIGKLEGKDIVLVQCGIGKVNAALCAQILISEFGVDAIVNTGVAGAIHSLLDVNDIVISTEAIQYDVDATPFGYKKGQIPQMDNSVFKADEKLVQIESLEALKEIANGEANKVFIPFEATNTLSSLGAIKEIIKDDKKSK